MPNPQSFTFSAGATLQGVRFAGPMTDLQFPVLQYIPLSQSLSSVQVVLVEGGAQNSSFFTHVRPV